MHRKFTPKIFILLTLLLGFVFISLLKFSDYKKAAKTDFSTAIETNNLINPQANITKEESLINKQLKSKSDKSISRYEHDTNIVGASVYFRNFNNGEWFVINGEKNYIPASIFKLFTLIGTMHFSKEHPEFLTYSVQYDGHANVNYNTSALQHPVVGSFYTTNELLDFTFSHSDNISHQLIKERLESSDSGRLNQIKTDFGVSTLDLNSFIKVEQIGNVFEKLYSASYLDQEMSIKALEYLIKAEFDEGLSNPLPEGTKIANKFGFRKQPFGNLIELHDCGIIYHPQNPYLLCVMTKGKDEARQSELIQDVSAVIWTEIDRQ